MVATIKLTHKILVLQTIRAPAKGKAMIFVIQQKNLVNFNVCTRIMAWRRCGLLTLLWAGFYNDVQRFSKKAILCFVLPCTELEIHPYVNNSLHEVDSMCTYNTLSTTNALRKRLRYESDKRYLTTLAFWHIKLRGYSSLEISKAGITCISIFPVIRKELESLASIANLSELPEKRQISCNVDWIELFWSNRSVAVTKKMYDTNKAGT